MVRGKRGQGWVEVGKRGENADICISIDNKNKEINGSHSIAVFQVPSKEFIGAILLPMTLTIKKYSVIDWKLVGVH